MCSQWAVLAMSAVAILAKPLAPPATGWLYTDDTLGKLGSFVFPFTATQCEPFYMFYMFYNSTDSLVFFPDDANATYPHTLFSITVPRGTGYLEWICNIPAGFEFHVIQNYIVQAGSSSACLGNITTTYSHLTYYTTAFASNTRTASPPVTSLSESTRPLPTTTFPTGTFSTITLNPNLAVMPTTSPPSSSSPVTSFTSSPPSPTVSSPSMNPTSPSPTPSHKSRNAAVAGGVVGAVAFLLLILAFMLRRRRRSSGLARTSSPINAQPTTTDEFESTYLSPPLKSSGAELPGTTPAPCSHGNELKSDSGAMVVPVAGSLEPAVVPVALSPAKIESTTGMPPATLSTQQAYEHSTITTGGGAVGSGNVNVSNVFHIYNIHHPQPDPSSSLPHLPIILPTGTAQASGQSAPPASASHAP